MNRLTLTSQIAISENEIIALIMLVDIKKKPANQGRLRDKWATLEILGQTNGAEVGAEHNSIYAIILFYYQYHYVRDAMPYPLLYPLLSEYYSQPRVHIKILP